MVDILVLIKVVTLVVDIDIFLNVVSFSIRIIYYLYFYCIYNLKIYFYCIRLLIFNFILEVGLHHIFHDRLIINLSEFIHNLFLDSS